MKMSLGLQKHWEEGWAEGNSCPLSDTPRANSPAKILNALWSALKGPQESPKDAKMVPGALQNGSKRSPRVSKKRTETGSHKKNRLKTIKQPPWASQGPSCQTLRRFRGPIWEAKSAPKRNQKRCKIEAKNQEAKKSIQDDLGPVLERSWVVLSAILGRPGPQNRAVAQAALIFSKNQFFDVITVGRRLLDQP